MTRLGGCSCPGHGAEACTLHPLRHSHRTALIERRHPGDDPPNGWIPQTVGVAGRRVRGDGRFPATWGHRNPAPRGKREAGAMVRQVRTLASLCAVQWVMVLGAAAAAGADALRPVTVHESMLTDVQRASSCELTSWMLRSIRPKRARRPFDASVDPTEARCAYSQMRKKTDTRKMYRGFEPGYPGSDCPGCNDRQGRLGAEVRRSAFPASNSCQAVYRGKNELTPEVP
jgi:hypothetical protein